MDFLRPLGRNGIPKERPSKTVPKHAFSIRFSSVMHSLCSDLHISFSAMSLKLTGRPALSEGHSFKQQLCPPRCRSSWVRGWYQTPLQYSPRGQLQPERHTARSCPSLQTQQLERGVAFSQRSPLTRTPRTPLQLGRTVRVNSLRSLSRRSPLFPRQSGRWPMSF